MSDIKKMENQEVEEMDEVVTLTDEEGNNRDFYVLAELDYKDKWYIYLEPVELNGDFNEGEIIIFELGEDEDGQETFNAIEDEEFLDEVFQVFVNYLKEDEGEE